MTEFLRRDGWNYSEKWKRVGQNFCVEVSRHSTPEFSGDYAKVVGTNHHWCVYLYIYPKHPEFARFKPDQDARDQPYYECHSYVSLFNVTRHNSGEIASFKLGWDYGHDGDCQFQEYATPDDASTVFYDAGRLFDDLAERANIKEVIEQ